MNSMLYQDTTRSWWCNKTFGKNIQKLSRGRKKCMSEVWAVIHSGRWMMVAMTTAKHGQWSLAKKKTRIFFRRSTNWHIFRVFLHSFDLAQEKINCSSRVTTTNSGATHFFVVSCHSQRSDFVKNDSRRQWGWTLWRGSACIDIPVLELQPLVTYSAESSGAM